MHLKVTRVKRGEKVYQYAQLVESYRRKDGMPTQRVIASLGRRSNLEIDNLRVALKASRADRAVILPEEGVATAGLEVLDNLAWLDVAVVLQVLRQLGVVDLLNQVLPADNAEVPAGRASMARTSSVWPNGPDSGVAGKRSLARSTAKRPARSTRPFWQPILR